MPLKSNMGSLEDAYARTVQEKITSCLTAEEISQTTIKYGNGQLEIDAPDFIKVKIKESLSSF